ncbi:MAG: DegT/DnrJ/EryC1/StrS family aminotransferase [Nitrospiraceae bacterium]
MILFNDLAAQYRSVQGELQQAVLKVLESGQYVLGQEVAAFEREFAEYAEVSQAVAVNSGTSALHLALLAAGVQPGDEVITVPFTFVATVAAIRYAGAIPVFVDVRPDTLTMDPALLARAMTPKTKAIIPVHLYGQAADLDPILAVAKTRGVAVIEDAAQAHGTRYKGRRVGGIGDLGCFSFYPGKNLGACGEGGIITTTNPAYVKKLRMLRDWGAERKYDHELLGFNYRMEAVQGAALRVKLRRLEGWTAARRKLAAAYDRSLKVGAIGHVAKAGYGDHVYHLYVVRVQERQAIIDGLQAKGIQTGIHYPVPVHLQPWAAELGYRAGQFPESEAAAATVLSLPLYPEMPEGQVAQVSAALSSLVREQTSVEGHAAGF